jgi:hypothetical protein
MPTKLIILCDLTTTQVRNKYRRILNV